MKILYPVVATNRDGKTVLLYTEDAVTKFVGENRVGYTWNLSTNNIDRWFVEVRLRHFGTPRPSFNWIIRDDRGRALDPTEFRFHFSEARWRKERNAKVRHAEALGLPIPGIRRRKRRKCHCYESCGGNKRRRAQETARENAKSNDYLI